MKFISAGILAIVYGVLLAGASLTTTEPESALAGGSTPTATPDPTFDPCDSKKVPPTCTVQATQPPRSESTNTPEPSDTPEATNTSPPAQATNTTAPPPSTATPGGGAGAGGVSPPDTGSGPGADGGISWMLVAGGLLAAAGAGSLAYGVRRVR